MADFDAKALNFAPVEDVIFAGVTASLPSLAGKCVAVTGALS